jgi:hypothetical protein
LIYKVQLALFFEVLYLKVCTTLPSIAVVKLKQVIRLADEQQSAIGGLFFYISPLPLNPNPGLL